MSNLIKNLKKKRKNYMLFKKVEKSYYFEKLLNESTVYDDEVKREIFEIYSKVNNKRKDKIFNITSSGGDVTELLETKKVRL